MSSVFIWDVISTQVFPNNLDDCSGSRVLAIPSTPDWRLKFFSTKKTVALFLSVSFELKNKDRYLCSAKSYIVVVYV